MLGATISQAGARLERHWVVFNSAMGLALGSYLWQFLATNQDYTGPLPVNLPLGLLITLLAGPAMVWASQLLYAVAIARLSGCSFQGCLRRDALSLAPLALLGVSPLVGLLTGLHTTAYNVGVVVLVSLSFSGCLATKAALAWEVLQESPKRPHLSDRAAQWVLITWAACFVALYSVLQVARYNAYQLWGIDHTMVTQALWNTLQGRFLAFTFVYGIPLNLLADHFEPIYALLVPAYAVWPDPRLPLLVQVTALGLGAWPLFRIAHRRLGSATLALGWALTYLVLPMTVAAAYDSAGAVRPDTLAIPIFLFMLDALDRENSTVLAITVVLAFAAKQYLSLLVAMLGLWIAIKQRRWRFGLALLVAGALWFLFLVQWLMPALASGPNLTLSAQFGPEVGEAGLSGLVQMLLTEPGVLLSRVFSPNHVLFLFFLLFSLGGLALLEPLLAAASLPIVAIFALAQPHAEVNLGNHHYFPIVPFLLVAAIYGVSTLRGGGKSHVRLNPGRQTAALTAFALGMSLTATFFWTSSPLSWGFWDSRVQLAYWPNRYAGGEHARTADRFVEMVPDEVPVLASDYLLAHLSNRPEVYHFFHPPEDVLQRVDHVVVDLFQDHVRDRDMNMAERELVRELLDGSQFGLTAHEDGLLYFQRGAAGGYASSARVASAAVDPRVRMEYDLGRRLRLLGYDPPATTVHAGERCQVTFYWQVLDSFDSPFSVKLGVNPQSVETHQTDYVLADRFTGPADDFHVLHLPTYIQLPPEEWQAGQVIQETYEFRLPASAHGEYTWSVGLYAVPRYLGINVDDARLVPDTEPVLLDLIEIQPEGSQWQ